MRPYTVAKGVQVVVNIDPALSMWTPQKCPRFVRFQIDARQYHVKRPIDSA